MNEMRCGARAMHICVYTVYLGVRVCVCVVGGGVHMNRRRADERCDPMRRHLAVINNGAGVQMLLWAGAIL